jgi:lipopolysaccharide export system protein LptC
MSELADTERRERQRWAHAGGMHDKTVRMLQLLLPALVGALAAVMLFAPFSERGELSFLLSKNEIAISPQRLRVDTAVYRGRDNQGRPFALTAGEAVQRSATDPVVRIRNLSARIMLADGPATLGAQTARYDPRSDEVDVPGQVALATGDGFRLLVRDVNIDLRSRTMSGSDGVSGSLPIGTFSANSIRADIETRRVALRGNVRTRLVARP